MHEHKILNQRNFWRFWLGGLLLLSLAIILSAPLSITNVEGGIIDHQSAGNALRVNEIQWAWNAAGLYNTAFRGMIIDLIFIGIYSFGTLCGGYVFRHMAYQHLRRLGSVIIVASMVFLITDYSETICQFIQLINNQGSDQLAMIAAFMQPIKMIAFLTSFIGILSGLLLQHWFNKKVG